MDRLEMFRQLNGWMVSGKQDFQDRGRHGYGKNLLKTYLVEANIPEDKVGNRSVGAFLQDIMSRESGSVRFTDDPTLWLLKFDGIETEHEFYLDTGDDRFWLIHTTSPAGESDKAIRGLIRNNLYLDSSWVPGNQLSDWLTDLGHAKVLTAKFAIQTGLYREGLLEDEYEDESLLMRIGASGDARVRWAEYASLPPLAKSLALWSARVVRTEAGSDAKITGDITASGKFTSRGDSFSLHQQMTSVFRSQYKNLVENVETQHRISWSLNRESFYPQGEVAEIRFIDSLTRDELVSLLGSIFNSREPYRLYGNPVERAGSRFVIQAVDLHTAGKLRFEISSTRLLVYLDKSTCGNALVRLLTNLQHYSDARLRLS